MYHEGQRLLSINTKYFTPTIMTIVLGIILVLIAFMTESDKVVVLYERPTRLLLLFFIVCWITCHLSNFRCMTEPSSRWIDLIPIHFDFILTKHGFSDIHCFYQRNGNVAVLHIRSSGRLHGIVNCVVMKGVGKIERRN